MEREGPREEVALWPSLFESGMIEIKRKESKWWHWREEEERGEERGREGRREEEARRGEERGDKDRRLNGGIGEKRRRRGEEIGREER